LPDHRVCRQIAESARQTRLTRNEGVPGSSPGVGFLRFAGKKRVARCRRGPALLEHILQMRVPIFPVEKGHLQGFLPP
jgi:hypothetical protein